MLNATLIERREELDIFCFLLHRDISLALLSKEQRGKLENLVQVHIFFPVELLVLTQAILQLSDLISQTLHVLSDLFYLCAVLDKKPVSVDNRLDVHGRENLHSIVVFELQTVHLDTEHLRKLFDPVSLNGLSPLIVRCKVVVNFVLIEILPSLVHVFGFQYAEHDLIEGVGDLLKLIFTLRRPILNERLKLSKESITDDASLFLSLLCLRLCSADYVRLDQAAMTPFGEAQLITTCVNHLHILLILLFAIDGTQCVCCLHLYVGLSTVNQLRVTELLLEFMLLQLSYDLLSVQALLDTSQECAIELSDIFLLANLYRVSVVVNYRMENFRRIRVLFI